MARAIAVAAILMLGVASADGTQTGDPTLIIVNGKVFTSEAGDAMAEAVAIQGDRILRVGRNDEIRALAGSETEVIDARGRSVLPGINDSHNHLLQGSLNLDKVDLLDAENLAQIEAKIRTFASANPDRPWVLGRGWYYAPFPGGLPTRQQLDALVPDRPAYLIAYDGHTAWANSKALAAAGITRATADTEGGIVVKDAQGEPTGILKESAQGLMSKALPPTTRADRVNALRAGIRHAHRHGITSVQSISSSVEEVEVYDELRKLGEFNIRASTAIRITPDFSEGDEARLDAIRRTHPVTDPLTPVNGIKMYADGVIEAHTGYLLAPYANRDTRGLPNYTADEMNHIVTMLDRRGWQVVIHAIGDAAVRMALDAFEQAANASSAPAHGRRHRIEHIETIDAADIPRFGPQGVIASMQPFHANPSPNQLEIWAGNIGPDRAARAWAWNSIAKAGGRLAFGSDWPVVSLDPRIHLHTAINRMTPKGAPAGGWLPEQRIPLADAIRAYTIGAAYVEFADDRKGTLAPGKFADVVIFSHDLFSLPTKRIMDAVVDVTIFDGKVVYRREGEAP